MMFGRNHHLPGYLRLFIVLVACFATLPSHATTASRVGGSGMSWMRTADTLNNGDIVVYDQLGIDTYVILNSNLSDFDTFNTIGVNYGLFDSLELGLQTSWISNDQHKSSGIKGYKGILKFNILGDKQKDNYAVSVSAFQTFSPADSTSYIASGDTEKGTEINASYYGNGINLHLTLGSATTDAKYYNPDVVYFSVDKQYANLGVEFITSQEHIFGIEAIQERSEDPAYDQNQLVAFSLQYKPQGKWHYDFGASFGIPEDRSEPGKSFYAGFIYQYDKQHEPLKPSRPVKSIPKRKASIPTPKYRKAGKPVFNKRPPVKIKAEPKKQKRKFKFMVRIKNATGSSATAKRVAAFLKQNGYGVESIKSISRREKTEIRYLKRNSKSALRLALKIPGNQDLRVMSTLKRGVDFELVIGGDIVRNLR